MIRICTEEDFSDLYEVINDGAQAYRGVIPPDRWQEPYMTPETLRREISAGVVFYAYHQSLSGEQRHATSSRPIGVMGMQDKGEVALIRHAYVRTGAQRSGIGGKLLQHLVSSTQKPILIGTWAAAVWAIRFYQKHGFQLTPPAEKEQLLRRFWNVPDRQIETSVVLWGNATPPVESPHRRLI